MSSKSVPLDDVATHLRKKQYLCIVKEKEKLDMKKLINILVIVGLICILALSWLNLWFAMIGFIGICIAMLLAILEPICE